jgi:uncharacterized protein YuzE
MKITYDPDIDSLTITLRAVPIRESGEISPSVIADYGFDGEVIALEVLQASRLVDNTEAIVFVLAISALVTPILLGGGRVLVLSKLIVENIASPNWPLAAVQAFVLLAMALTILIVFTRLNRATYAAKET